MFSSKPIKPTAHRRVDNVYHIQIGIDLELVQFNQSFLIGDDTELQEIGIDCITPR